MKILCVIGSMSIGGGAERVMSLLVNYLSSSHEVTWLSIYHCDGPMYKTNNEVSIINGLNQKNKVDAIIRLHRFIKTNKPDIGKYTKWSR